MERFAVDRKQFDLLKSMGVSLREVLKKAELPEDLFSRKIIAVTGEEYIRLINAVEYVANDEEINIRLATIDNIETFSPPIFAAYCSRNAVTCVNRLSKYKKLVGPMVMIVEETEEYLSIELKYKDDTMKLPKFLVATELVFLIQLMRNATKKKIIPYEITSIYDFKSNGYREFFGNEIKLGEKNLIKISKEDALLPFISENDSMWEYFEPELKRRLSELEIEDTYSARVRSALIELLPSGLCSIDDVANKLGYSKRTLQRKLKDEQTTFQKQLNHTRELLAKHYIRNSDMSSDDIAYLLGYQDLNSFIRAFNIWTGLTISEYKREIYN